MCKSICRYFSAKHQHRIARTRTRAPRHATQRRMNGRKNIFQSGDCKTPGSGAPDKTRTEARVAREHAPCVVGSETAWTKCHVGDEFPLTRIPMSLMIDFNTFTANSPRNLRDGCTHIPDDSTLSARTSAPCRSAQLGLVVHRRRINNGHSLYKAAARTHFEPTTSDLCHAVTDVEKAIRRLAIAFAADQ